MEFIFGYSSLNLSYIIQVFAKNLKKFFFSENKKIVFPSFLQTTAYILIELEILYHSIFRCLQKKVEKIRGGALALELRKC